MKATSGPWLNRRRKIVFSLLALVLVYETLATAHERRRLAAVFPGAPATTTPLLDHARLLADVATLSGPAFEGRRTGEPGGLKARAWVESRFREIGLAPIDAANGDNGANALTGATASYLEPFSFDHTSVKALWRRDRPVRMHFADAANVVGELAGTADPASYLVVSAHYDHLGIRNGRIYPGADDNASGVATMLALAAYFKTHPPRHSILFVAFDAEELGLRGAQAFVARPPVTISAIRLDVNFDMVSRSATHDLVVTGLADHPELQSAVLQAASRSGVHLHAGHDRSMLLGGRVEDWRHGSDQGAFLDAGIPYLYLGVEDHADYHQPTDTADKIDPGFFADTAELARDLVATLDATLQN
ncbi:MAG: M20/M25/M40 family metallo-hydrolase [Thermoanaerobaculia bacterium]